MRLIDRNELPGINFWVKHPGDSKWYRGEYDSGNHNALVITVLTTPHIGLTVTADQAAHEGYLWNTVNNDSGARAFYIEEPNDVELRTKLYNAGNNPFTLVFKSGIAITCTKSVHGFIPLLATGLFDHHVTFEIIVSSKSRLVNWYDIEKSLIN